MKQDISGLRQKAQGWCKAFFGISVSPVKDGRLAADSMQEFFPWF